jgi:hypothetical protein
MNISAKYSGSKLTVSINNVAFFQGTIKKKFWKKVWTLFDSSKKEVATYVIMSKYFVYDFKMKISINSHESNQNIHLNYKNKMPHFFFDYRSCNYLIVFHSGNKVSFFKENQQFASMKKKSISGWSGQGFVIIADDDIDTALFIILLSSVLIVRHNEPDGDSDFTIDLGSFIKELQPFDQTWHPKILSN